MTIKTGDKIPACTMKTMGEKGPTDITTDEIFAGKKVLLFAVPGAFTPGCSITHLPGYVVNADKIKAKGVDTIVCMSVNDGFVMGAWGKAQNAEALLMLADGNGDFAAALGLELDGNGFGWRELEGHGLDGTFGIHAAAGHFEGPRSKVNSMVGIEASPFPPRQSTPKDEDRRSKVEGCVCVHVCVSICE